ncbi:MAG: hypothetical protein JWM02_2295 [Frankiales bacterium]|nr:hypothetical protein [Frankiales bacterium]
MKTSGEMAPRYGMGPAQQRLDACWLSRPEVDDGLVVQLELVGAQCCAQVGEELGAVTHGVRDDGVVDGNASASCLFRFVEGRFHLIRHCYWVGRRASGVGPTMPQSHRNPTIEAILSPAWVKLHLLWVRSALG